LAAVCPDDPEIRRLDIRLHRDDRCTGSACTTNDLFWGTLVYSEGS
jgi:hypothetical protein